jgi:hypothetical protein
MKAIWEFNIVYIMMGTSWLNEGRRGIVLFIMKQEVNVSIVFMQSSCLMGARPHEAFPRIFI